MSGISKLRHYAAAALALALAACGGGGDGPAVQPPSPPPPPPPPPVETAIDVEPAFPGVSFAQPVSLVQAPGDASRWFVVEQQGIIRVFDNDPAVNQATVFLDITDRVNDTFSESGLLGIAFHPAFPTTADVFVNYTTGNTSLLSRVSRFTVDASSGNLDPASEDPLFEVAQPATNHNGGDLAFGTDGFLYASFGDGGGSGDPNGNAQDRTNLLGTIVRIDVDVPGAYEVPADNPFFGAAPCQFPANRNDPCPEIYAWGLRNPWRFSVDAATGNVWIGDVGQSSLEEVDRIDASQDPQSRNFGWNVQEGTSCFNPSSGCDSTGLLPPITEYGRTLGVSITGGYVYRGSAIPGLAGTYVFGDFGSGRIFGVAADSQPTVVPDELLESGFSISTFATDTDGELYVVDYGSGTIYAVVAAP